MADIDETSRPPRRFNWHPRLSAGEMLFAVVGLPLGLAGFAFMFVALYLGTTLALTVVGLPVLAAGLRCGRRLARLHARLVRQLLGQPVADPGPPEVAEGVVAWTRAALTDLVSWRAMVYLGLRLPVSVLGFLAAVGMPVAGLWLIGYPLFARLLTDDPTPVWAWVVVPVGIPLVVFTPAAVRATNALNRALARLLLGPSPGQKRVGALVQARSTLAAESTRSLRWIERDLHDGTQAELVAIAMTLSLTEDELDARPELALSRLPELVRRARQQTEAAIASLRRITTGINPVALDGGLEAALPGLIAGCPVPVDLELAMDDDSRPDPAIERVMYFCVAELLTNITKHSRARRARVAVAARNGRARVTVSDDGHGGAGPDDGISAGSGLSGLADRLAAVDGTLEISSPPGMGTVIIAMLPTSV